MRVFIEKVIRADADICYFYDLFREVSVDNYVLSRIDLVSLMDDHLSTVIGFSYGKNVLEFIYNARDNNKYVLVGVGCGGGNEKFSKSFLMNKEALNAYVQLVLNVKKSLVHIH